MKFSKQAMLGTGVLVGGSVLLYATVQQILHSKPAAPQNTPVVVASAPAPSADTPLTVDINTEKQLLEQKQKEREARVQAQEQAAQQYQSEQQTIEAQALARSRAENALYNQPASTTEPTPIVQPVVKPRPVTNTVATVTETQPVATPPVKPSTNTQPAPTVKVETKRNNTPTNPPAKTGNIEQKAQQKTVTKPPVVAERKAEPIKVQPKTVEQTTTAVRPSRYQVAKGEGLISLSRRYNVPVEILATANGLDKNAALRVGQTLNIPSANEVNRLQQQAIQQEQQRQQQIARKKQEALQKEQQKQQYQAAQQKLKEARQIAKSTDAKGSFGVQVALAADEAKAEEVAKKLQAAGYQVKTSPTSRGVRVVVGPETGKIAALALKDKINADPRVPVDNGWVLYW